MDTENYYLQFRDKGSAFAGQSVPSEGDLPSEGVCLSWGICLTMALWESRPPCEQTNTCENITLPDTLYAAGKYI